MTKRRAIPTAPEPLEAYARHFDDLFGKSNQRDEFRRYLEGLLLPTERNKTLTGLANTEPYVGAQHPRAQGMQWFLSEASWQEKQVQERRLQVLFEEPSTAPNEQGVLVIDEHGDRKKGQKTAHSGRQYLATMGKTDNGVVSVTSLWADEDVYYPLDFEPYTPADYFAEGSWMGACGASRALDQGHADVALWLLARLVGLGTGHPSLWTRQAGTGNHCHHRSGHLARIDHILPDYQSPRSRIAACARE